MRRFIVWEALFEGAAPDRGRGLRSDRRGQAGLGRWLDFRLVPGWLEREDPRYPEPRGRYLDVLGPRGDRGHESRAALRHGARLA